MVTRISDPALFPSFVTQHSVALSPPEMNRYASAFPDVALPASLRNAAPKRQAEFLAGRLCAREALSICAPEHVATPIAISDCRQPLWPTGIVGSITHADGIASAALARMRDARGVGLDIEPWMTDQRGASLLGRIAAFDEVEPLVEQAGWPLGRALTLAFSAKETLFKCLYPSVRRYFEFRAAAVVSVHVAAGRFALRLADNLTPALRAGFALEGRFECGERRICTAMVWQPSSSFPWTELLSRRQACPSSNR